MNIHQLSVNYIQDQDRILARINTTAGEELRLWFTRRLTLGLMPALRRVVATHVAKMEAIQSPHISPTAAADAQTQQMLSDFKKEESLQKSDFKTPFKAEASTLPLGAEPLLVTEININPLSNGQLQLAFNEKIAGHEKTRGFQMGLEQNLLHGFLHLLEKAVSQSQWAGDAQQSGVEKLPGEAENSVDKPKYLN